MLSAIFNKRMLICLLNGFTAGLPLFFLLGLIPAWLRHFGIDLKTIGLMALIGLPYTWKFLWAPLLDRYTLPFLGRRRGWMLVSQIALMVSMFMMGLLNPTTELGLIIPLALIIAFLSASQDIVLDAYRRDFLKDEELGLGNAMYVNGYRVAGLIPAGLGLILADYLPWEAVYLVVALFMSVGLFQTLLAPRCEKGVHVPHSLHDAVVMPFKEFFKRDSFKQGLLVLCFLLTYKLGDNMATALATPFYIDMGFSMTVIGSMVKLINFWAILLGTFVGGAVIYKIGINRALWIFGVCQMVPILGFSFLSTQGPNVTYLGMVIGLECLGIGLGSAALMAFMAKSTHRNFSATQFALFSALMAVPRTLANAVTGFLIEGIGPKDGLYYTLFGEWKGMGYTAFFIFCTFCALPGMTLLKWVAPWSGKEEDAHNETSIKGKK